MAILLVPNSHTVWGLPLAEHPVRRYWHSVEGGTVLTNISIETIWVETSKKRN
jgi:hypothetical protein